MPETPLESFSRFNYLLRPSKQVERKLFIEALHRLALGNFRIHEYTYLGFGSPYYADFILFHKYLYIDTQKRPTRFIIKSVDWGRRGYLRRLQSR